MVVEDNDSGRLVLKRGFTPMKTSNGTLPPTPDTQNRVSHFNRHYSGSKHQTSSSSSPISPSRSLLSAFSTTGGSTSRRSKHEAKRTRTRTNEISTPVIMTLYLEVESEEEVWMGHAWWGLG